MTNSSKLALYVSSALVGFCAVMSAINGDWLNFGLELITALALLAATFVHTKE